MLYTVHSHILETYIVPHNICFLHLYLVLKTGYDVRKLEGNLLSQTGKWIETLIVCPALIAGSLYSVMSIQAPGCHWHLVIPGNFRRH